MLRSLSLDRLWLSRCTCSSNCKPHHLGVAVWKSTLHEFKAQHVIRSLPAHGAWLVRNQIESIASEFQSWKKNIRKTWLAARPPGLFEWIFISRKATCCFAGRSPSLLSFSICLFQRSNVPQSDSSISTDWKYKMLCWLFFQMQFITN